MNEPKHNEATLHVAAWLFARMRYGPGIERFDVNELSGETADALSFPEPDLALLVPAIRMFLAEVDFPAVSRLVTAYARSCEIADNIRELQGAV